VSKYEIYKREDKNIRENWFKDHVPTFTYSEDGNIIKIKWKKPGDWNFAVIYYIDQNSATLFVSGDLGEAVYSWGSPISINFLGGCDLDYFDGKCRASSCGERGKTWNQEVAIDFVKQYIETHTFGEDQGDSLFSDLYLDGHIEDVLKNKYPEMAVLYTEDGYKAWKDLSADEKNKIISVSKDYLRDLYTSGKWESLNKTDYRYEVIKNKNVFEDLRHEAIGACETEFNWVQFLSDYGDDFFGSEYYEYADIGKTISLRVQSHLIGLKMIRDGLNEGKFSMNPSVSPKPEVKKKSLLERICNWILS